MGNILGSNNEFPSLLIKEGTTPTSPAAGDQRLFVRSSDHVLCLVNSGGTVAAVGNYNSGVPWTSGTSMPGSPVTNQRITRTDLGLDCYWDGTEWVTVTEYSGSSTGDTLIGNNNSNSWTLCELPVGPGDIYVTTVECSTDIITTNDGTHYWTVTANKVSTANANTSLGSFTTAADTASTWSPHSIAVNAAVVRASFPSIRLNAAPTSTPGVIYFAVTVRYRRIVT